MIGPRSIGAGSIVVAIASSACSTSSPTSPPTDATVDVSNDVATIAACTDPVGPFAPLTVRCGQLFDAQGRVVVLRGVNARVSIVFDEDLGAGKTPLETIPTIDASDFSQMRALGFNVLRLPIQWSGVEPNDTSPPTYVASYLDRVAATVALAKAAGMYVLLDFHQDAFSKYVGEDGAPLWAIQPPPTQILQGPLTDLGTRRLSQQVGDAFTTFFTVTDSTGQRLRARFGQMAAAVARRFLGDATVVGLELFNEPDATDDMLRNFHEEVGAAIRATDPTRLLFIEPPSIRNIVDHASIPSAPLTLAGVVYAPHVYTHAFTQGDDSAWKSSFTYDDLLPSNQSARDEATGWNAALFVGELGWDPQQRFSDYIGWQLQAQDAVMASSTIWVWKEESQGSWGFFDHDATSDTWTPRPAVAAVFSGRITPHAIAGLPAAWSWDPIAHTFEVDFLGDGASSSTNALFVPTGTATATCDGLSVAIDRSDMTTMDAIVECGGPGTHRLHVAMSGS
ncbi:MAG: glycoside hydrolase family 5 protein [Polyangiales bacterium]